MLRRSRSMMALAAAGALMFGFSMTARADDVSRASAAEFWAQHASTYTWTTGQGNTPIAVAPPAMEPYALSGNAPTRQDAAKFWLKYSGQTVQVGNGVMFVPTVR
jgi:hypothetical protein